jgi:hypothetical protein
LETGDRDPNVEKHRFSTFFSLPGDSRFLVFLVASTALVTPFTRPNGGC